MTSPTTPQCSVAAAPSRAKTKELFERSFIALRGPASNVVGSNYYEGEEITIYRCEPKKVKALLSVSCGA
jgi:hypothetical protein